MVYNNLNILILDDDLDWYPVLKDMFAKTSIDHRLYHARNINEYRKICEQKRIDVALIDLNLREEQGINTLIEVNACCDTLPVVVVTNTEDKNLAFQTVEKGAQDYLLKSTLTPEILFRVIQYAIERKKLNLQLKRMNEVLSTIREINLLITTEKKPENLLSRACEVFTENSQYRAALALLISEKRGKTLLVNKGMDNWRERLEKDIEKGKFPPCFRKLFQRELTFKLSGEGDEDCYKCSLGSFCSEGEYIIASLMHNKIIVGIVVIQFNGNFHLGGDEIGLILEGARDIALALYNIELERGKMEAERKTRESEIRFKTFFNMGNDAIIIHEMHPELKGKILEVNKIACERYGYSNEDWGSLRFNQICSNDVQDKLPEIAAKLSGDEVYLEESRHITAGGEVFPVEVNHHLFRIDDREVIHSIIRDMTEQSRLKEKIFAIHKIYRDAIENAGGVPYFFVYEAGIYDFIGDKCEDLLEISSGDLTFNTFKSLIREIKITGVENGESPEQFIREFKAGKLRKYEARYLCELPSGKLKWISDYSTPVWDDEGKQVVGSLGILQDVTPLVEATENVDRLYHQQLIINQVALALGKTFQSEEIYNILYENIKRLMDVDVFIVSRFNRKTKLITAEYVNKDGKIINSAQFPEISLEEEGIGTQNKVIRTGKALIVNDLEEELKKVKDLYYIGEEGEIIDNVPDEAADRSRSALLAPIKIGGSVWGVMQVQSYQLKAYSDNDKSLLEGLANVAAVSLQNAVLYTNLSKELKRRKTIEGVLGKSLKEKELLLQEVHHRVKNNLQLIISLLNLQSETIRDKKTIDHFRKAQIRVHSIALVHELLYQSESLESIELKDYILRLAMGLRQMFQDVADRVNIKVECDDIKLAIEKAIPCGLILNEILTNSLKYAFPDGQKGQILVDIRKIKASGIEMTIEDNGVGIPAEIDTETTSSLGLRLIRILVEDQLDGKLRIERNEGTKYHIRLEEVL